MSNSNTAFSRLLKKPICYVLFLLAGCGRAEFPFCCDLAGTSDVPVVKTYNFQFRSGFVPLFGAPATLTIATAGDVANFQAAANLIPDRDPATGLQLGTISGLMADGAGNPQIGLTLDAFDAAGNSLSRKPTQELNLFYNGLGGIPDFSNTTGTSDTGSFTLFNAPPGQVFFKVIKGGRGNGRVFSFLDSVSFMTASAVLAIPDTIPMTGVVSDLDNFVLIPGAAISALGYGPLATSTSAGTFNIPERAGTANQGPSLKSAGSFYFKVTAPGYYDTYQFVTTNPADIQAGTTDLTQFLKLQSRFQLAKATANEPISIDPQKGILTGVIRQVDRTPQSNATVEIRDVNGKLLAGDGVGDLYYRTQDLNNSARNRLLLKAAGGAQTSGNGEFIALNLPPGKLYLTVVATLASASANNPDKYSSAREVPIFGGSAFFIDTLPVVSNLIDDNNPAYIPSHSQKVGGTIRTLTGQPADGVTISALGFSGDLAISDVNGQYLIPAYTQAVGGIRRQDRFQPVSQPCTITYVGIVLNDPSKTSPDCALIAGGDYILRLSPPTGFPTYQEFVLGVSRTVAAQQNGDVRNLTVLTPDQLPGNALASGTAVVAGTLLSLNSGKTVGGVSLQVTDEQGNGPIGTIYYIDDQNQPRQTGASFNNGRFLVTDIPVGGSERFVFLTISSTDDSGTKPVRVVNGAATVFDLTINKSPALLSDVSGIAKDLRGNPISGASGRILGECLDGEKPDPLRVDRISHRCENEVPFPTDGSGAYTLQLQSAGTYIARLTKQGFLPSDNYQIRTGIGNRVNSNLYMTSMQELSDLSGGQVVQDPAKGVIAGRLMTSGFQPVLAVDPYNALSPVFDSSNVGVITGFFDSDEIVDAAVVGSGGGGGLIQILSGVDRAATGLGEGLFKQVCQAVQNGPCVPSPIVRPDGTPIPFPIGQDLRDVTAADFNGDGLVDLAVVDHNPSSDPGLKETGVFLFFSNGNGTFTRFDDQIFTIDPTQGRRSVTPADLGTGAVAIQVLDYNNDNVTDLAVLTDQGILFVLVGIGDGTFQAFNSTGFRTGTGSLAPGAREFAVGNFNTDAFLDFAVADTNNDRITVLGNSLLATPAVHPTDARPFAIGTGDFDQDGALDWVVLCDTLSGDPSGYFINVVFARAAAIRLRIQLTGPEPPQKLNVFDYDQDGRPDILLTYPSGKGAVYYGDGAGHLSDPNPVDLCPPGCSIIGTARGVFNQDLRADLVSVATDRVYVALGSNSPLDRIRVEATAATSDQTVNGVAIGRAAYFKDLSGSPGSIDMSSTGTTTFTGDGRFVIYNVPPGLTMVRASAGGAGNAYVEVKPGEMVYLEIQTFGSPPETIFATGAVGDFVGNRMPGSEIRFLGTNLSLFSGASGQYQGFLRAQSDYIVFLDRAVGLPNTAVDVTPCNAALCP